MSKVLYCADVVPGCQAVVRADSEDEIMRQAVVHARDAHDMQQVDSAMAERVRAAIKTGP
jgi:predicted small metal-binding protein